MSNQFDRALLEEFMEKFYEYGNPVNSYWFIGLEEKAGEPLKELYDRIGLWERLNKPTHVSCKDYHAQLGKDELFLPNTNIKHIKVWSRIIRIYLAAQGGTDITYKSIREYLANHFLTLNGDTCMMELFPLPGIGTASKVWPYANIKDVPNLKTRKKYEEYITDKRVKFFKEGIIKFKPKVVVFYSVAKKYVPYWRKIINCSEGEFATIELPDGKINYLKKDNILFLVIPFVNGYPGEPMKLKFLEQIGKFIKEHQ